MKIVSKVTIESPVKDAWDFFDNAKNLSKWQKGLKHFKPIRGTIGEVGALGKHIYEDRGKTWELTEVITQKDPLKRRCEVLSDRGMIAKVENAFEDLGNGKTSLTCTTEVKFKTLGFKLLGPFMKKELQKRQDNDFKRLKKQLEVAR